MISKETAISVYGLPCLTITNATKNKNIELIYFPTFVFVNLTGRYMIKKTNSEKKPRKLFSSREKLPIFSVRKLIETRYKAILMNVVFDRVMT